MPGRGPQRVLRFFRVRPDRPVLMAGSTMQGRGGGGDPRVQPAAGDAGRADALLVIAARHPERFDEVERLCRQEGLSTMRRTELPIDAEPRVDAVILDTIGELAQLYQIATAVFVGGSLVPAGGHNILEPAVYGKPIVFGPHMENFNEIAETFLANGAAVQVQSERELERRAAGADGRSGAARAAGRGGAGAGRGQSRREGQDDGGHRRSCCPPHRTRSARGPSVPRGPLSALERPLRPRGVRAPRVVRRAARTPCGACRVRSISVGNLVVGGSGKTPVAALVARLLLDARRAAGDPQPRLRRGASRRTAWWWSATGARCWAAVERPATSRSCSRRRCPASRSSCAPTATWRGSWRIGRFGATVLVLDDGFQHLQLARDVDLLLVCPEDLRRGGAAGGPAARAAGRGDGRRRGAGAGLGRPKRSASPAQLGVARGFAVPRSAHVRAGRPAAARAPRVSRSVAVAGIARPERFLTRSSTTAGTWPSASCFRDHHWFTAADLARIDRPPRARPCGRGV